MGRAMFGLACILHALYASSLALPTAGLEHLPMRADSCNDVLVACVRDLACSPLLSELPPEESITLASTEQEAVAQCAKNKLCGAVLQCIRKDTALQTRRRQMQVNTGCTMGAPITLGPCTSTYSCLGQFQ
jgi:hypothetical protein